MKHVKMSVLGALMAAVVAVALGAGTASATVLCPNNTEPCSSPYGKGTEIGAALKAGTKSRFESSLFTIECSESTLSGSTASAGSASETVRGLPAAWSTGGCNWTVDILNKGELEIHHIAGTSAGTLTGKASEITVSNAGVDCIYGPGTGTDIGKLAGSSENGGGTATIKIESTIKKLGGSFLCPSVAKWSAEYTISAPDFLNVKGS